ncbi:hypothetical protein ACHHYP_20477 [Achlya hypogyna]|uniref:PiggyBac transposable element-derived protein domain-containing protein n=1 Tax=Achlya hypogyna TaxID=1202772 RepID=A0A1V9YLE1_ACHHY|nr:hypothetical protein ACHHYP_20477 [Achlya hypogyna]
MPHVTKIKRKSEGVRGELNTVACATNKILLKIDIVEKAAHQHKTLFHSEYGARASSVIRLCEDCFGSCHTVLPYSAFSSVKTLLALKTRGLCLLHGHGENLPLKMCGKLGTTVHFSESS